MCKVLSPHPLFCGSLSSVAPLCLVIRAPHPLFLATLCGCQYPVLILLFNAHPLTLVLSFSAPLSLSVCIPPPLCRFSHQILLPGCVHAGPPFLLVCIFADGYAARGWGLCFRQLLFWVMRAWISRLASHCDGDSWWKFLGRYG